MFGLSHIGAPQAGFCVLSAFPHQTLSLSLLLAPQDVPGLGCILPNLVLESALGKRYLGTTVWVLGRPPGFVMGNISLCTLIHLSLLHLFLACFTSQHTEHLLLTFVISSDFPTRISIMKAWFYSWLCLWAWHTEGA